jgi:hypothetical protein
MLFAESRERIEVPTVDDDIAGSTAAVAFSCTKARKVNDGASERVGTGSGRDPK